MKKFKDIFEMEETYKSTRFYPDLLIGKKESDTIHRVLIEYSIYEKELTCIYFAAEVDFIAFKQRLLDKNEDICCINHSNGCEEYIFKRHILSVDMQKGELLSCRGTLHFGTLK